MINSENKFDVHLEALVRQLRPQEIPAWADIQPGTEAFIRLHGETSQEDVFRTLLQLLACNADEGRTSLRGAVASLLQAETVILPGGIGVRERGDLQIVPGCCCGLETWFEWRAFLTSGLSPWMGHDPLSKIERRDHDLLITTRPGTENECSVAMSEMDLKQNIARIEDDLMNFSSLLGAFLENNAPEFRQQFSVAFHRWFSIAQNQGRGPAREASHRQE